MKKLINHRGVKLSSTLGGQRELIREMRNKINEIIDFVEQSNPNKEDNNIELKYYSFASNDKLYINAKEVVGHEVWIKGLKPENPNSPEEYFKHKEGCVWGDSLEHVHLVPIDCYVPKTEDTGECKCLFIGPQGEERFYKLNNCPIHSTPEVKTQQGWEEAFDKEFKFISHKGVQCDEITIENLKNFISQEIESSNRRMVEKIANDNFNEELGTYDYDGIAEDVLEELK